jgi:hypothetical protein
MFTKDILFGMNILSLAGFAVMGLTLTLRRMAQAGSPVCIGLMCVGTVLVFLGLYGGSSALAMKAPKSMAGSTSSRARSVSRASSARVEASGPCISSNNHSRASVTTYARRSSASQNRRSNHALGIRALLPRQLAPSRHIGNQGRLGLRPCFCNPTGAPCRDLMIAKR